MVNEEWASMTQEPCCLICNETKASIRASQRTSDPIYCFDGMDEAPHHVFVDLSKGHSS